MVGLPIRVIEPAKRNRVHDSSVGSLGTRDRVDVAYHFEPALSLCLKPILGVSCFASSRV